MLDQPQVWMMAGAIECCLGVERVRHTTLSAAGVAFHDDVRRITRSTELAEAQRRWSARDISLVREVKPREIRQVSLPTGEQKSHRQRRGWPTSPTPETPLMNIFCSVRPVWVLDQLENAGLHGGEGVADGAAHPPRKRHHRHSNGWR